MSRLLEEECKNQHPLALQVHDFLHHLQTQRRMSAHTIAAYSRDLQSLLRASLQHKTTTINSTILRACLANDSRRGLTPSSIARRLSAWRMFFDYLIQRDAIKTNPAKEMRAPKKPPRLPRALTPDEMSHFLDSTQAPQSPSPIAQWQAQRDAAMFELLYASGMRVGEMILLDIADIDFAAATARIVRGKGGHGRIAPFGDAAKRALQSWLSVRNTAPATAKKSLAEKSLAEKSLATKSLATKSLAENNSALFINSRGGRLSTRSVQQRIANHAKLLGMRERISPHVLRHSCASHFLQSSQDLRATQELLGHADITSTQIYTRLDFQNLAQSYDRAHPRALKTTPRKKPTN